MKGGDWVEGDRICPQDCSQAAMPDAWTSPAWSGYANEKDYLAVDRWRAPVDSADGASTTSARVSMDDLPTWP